jgi:hypothetical protein
MRDDTTRMPKQKCPHCGYVVDANGPSGPLADGAEIPRPEPGDYTVCIACAGICQYSETMQMIATTIEDPDLDPEARQEMRRMIAAIEYLKSRQADWPLRDARRSRA